MKLRMLNRWFHCTLPLLFVIPLMAGAVTPINGLPAGLTQPCDDKVANQKKIDDALKNPSVAQGCRDQIKKSAEACLTEPVMTDAEKTQMGGGSASAGVLEVAKTQLAGLNLARDRYEGHSDSCKAEAGHIADACKQMNDALLQAIHDNGIAQEAAQTKLASTVSSDPNRATYIEQVKNDQDNSRQLQNDRDVTNQAASTAGHALEEEVQCADNLVRIYQSEIDRTQAVVDSSGTTSTPHDQAPTVSSAKTDPLVSGTRDNAIQGGASVATKAAGVAAETTTNTTMAAGLKTLGSAAKAVGPTGLLYSAYQGDGVGVAAQGTQMAIEVAAPAAAEVIAGPLAGVALIMQASPTASCDTRTIDPVQAYRTGCSVNTLAGAQSNEAAITALNH